MVFYNCTAVQLASLWQKSPSRKNAILRRTMPFMAFSLFLLAFWRKYGKTCSPWKLLARAASQLRTDVRAIGYLLQLVDDTANDPKTYTKTSFWGFVSAFCYGAIHEALTNDGTSCEQVVARCVGDDFTALCGRVAIVTGASGGLGLENARCLMKYGCHVVWAVRNPQRAESALKSLVEANGGPFSGQATILKLELSDLTSVKPFVEAFLSLNIPLHYLILNAGIMAPVAWEPSVQGHENMFATNNLGHFLLTELLLPKLKKTASSVPGTEARTIGDALLGTDCNEGHQVLTPALRRPPSPNDVRIVVLSSIAGTMCSGMDLAKVPAPKDFYSEFADYTVTKAIDAFHVRQLQKDLKGTGISATAVHPGIINTNLGCGNDGIIALLYGCSLTGFARKGIPSGAATTMYCALNKDVPEQVDRGCFYYYNRAPQNPMGIIQPGRRDDLCESLHDLQMSLVKQYM